MGEINIQEDVVERIKETQRKGKKNFIVLVAEGVGQVFQIAEEIEKNTGIETRATVLGHVQRGGSPSMRDRVVAAQMGVHAVELVDDGKYNRIVAIKNGAVVDYDIEEALSMKKVLDSKLVEISYIISN